MTTKPEEDVLLVITDTHVGKTTRSFNPEIAAERMKMVAENVERVVGIMRAAYHLPRIHIAFLGDLADGSGIYPTQSHHQEMSNPDAQSIYAAEHLFVPFLKRMALTFERVDVYSVPGNHGRIGKHAHEAANWDITCMRYTALMLQGHDRIACHVADLPVPIKVIDIRGHGHLLYHGNEIRSFANIPWYGMMVRLMRWRNSSLSPWRVAHMGHFHSCGRWQINQFEMFSSGTMVTHDEWAFQVLGWESANKWWLMGVSDDRPVTWAFQIDTAESLVVSAAELAPQTVSE